MCSHSEYVCYTHGIDDISICLKHSSMFIFHFSRKGPDDRGFFYIIFFVL